jgi:hypothetical protein
MTRTGIAVLCAATALATADLAQAQRGGGGGDAEALSALRPTTRLNRPAKPPTAETEAWITKEVQAGDGWSVVSKDADGVVLARPAGAVRNDGIVPMHLRIEYRQPLTINRREVRSVVADIDVDCGTEQMGAGQVNGFEGANLAGRKIALEAAQVAQNGPGSGKIVTLNPRAEGLKLLTGKVLRDQCADGHRAIAGKFGPEWRPLLADETGVRLIGVTENVGLDRKIDVTFRIEAQSAQADPNLKWRSAISRMKLDCVDGLVSADTTLYSGANQTGNSANLAFDGILSPTGLRSHAPGETPAPTAKAAPAASGGRGGLGAQTGDAGPGKSVVGMLRDGFMVLSECEAAKARLASALSTPGDPLRRQAEAWVSQSLKTKGFRLPIYVPEGVFLLSDEVAALPAGVLRAAVRAEYSRPVLGRDGKKMASRLILIELDCKARKVRGISENTYAGNNARDLINEAAAAQAPWADFEEQPVLISYFEAACATTPAS